MGDAAAADDAAADDAADDAAVDVDVDTDVNADFTRRVVLHADEIPWRASPMPGVDRRRLDRVRGEHERVTTIVRYASGSRFSSHVHGGGEEFVVLDGVFEDDYGAWPAGSYIRNPPGSSHTPGSGPGCTILVKLWQFDPDDRTFVHTHLDRLGAVPEAGREGVSVSPLYMDDRENVRVERWAPGVAASVDTAGGAELFVLEGTCREGGDDLRRHSWLRVPPGSASTLEAGPDGARVWVKSGHLARLVADEGRSVRRRGGTPRSRGMVGASPFPPGRSLRHR